MAATLLLEQIREAVAAWPVGKRFDLGEALDRLALMLVSDLALGEAPVELIDTAAKTLEGLRRAARPMGLLRKALAPRSRSGFQSLRSVAEPYLAIKVRSAANKLPPHQNHASSPAWRLRARRAEGSSTAMRFAMR